MSRLLAFSKSSSELFESSREIANLLWLVQVNQSVICPQFETIFWKARCNFTRLEIYLGKPCLNTKVHTRKISCNLALIRSSITVTYLEHPGRCILPSSSGPFSLPYCHWKPDGSQWQLINWDSSKWLLMNWDGSSVGRIFVNSNIFEYI